MKLLLDAMSDAALWKPLLADGNGPSDQVTVAADQTECVSLDDHTSLKFSVGAGATGHRIQRTVAGLADLSQLDEIRFWVFSNRVADGSASAPAFARLRLGSATSTVGTPGNTWFRDVPVNAPATWELVRVSLDDLAANVRSAVTQIEFLLLNITIPITFQLDSLMAVRDELVTDIEAALAGLLNEKISAGNTKIPAAFYNPDGAAGAAPLIRLYLSEIRVNEDHNAVMVRRDYAGNLFREQRPPTGYSLIYEIDPVAAEIDTRSRILDFVLNAFAPRNFLEVNGVRLPVEWQARRPSRLVQGTPERFRLRFLIRTWRSAGTSAPLRTPFGQVNITADTPDARAN